MPRRRRPMLSSVLAVAILFSAIMPGFVQARTYVTTFTANQSESVVELAGTVARDLGKPASVSFELAQKTFGQVILTLRPRNEAEFEQLAYAVQNPAASRYRQPLSEAEYQARFAPEQATLETLKKYFQAQGLSIGYESSDGLLVGFKGSIAQLDAAFQTRSEYRTDSKGSEGFVNVSPLRLPISIAKLVKGVTGFDTLHTFEVANSSKVASIGVNVAITSTNTPTSTRTAYNFDAIGLTGTGVQVATTLWGAPSRPDLARYEAYFGRPLSLTVIPATPPAVEDGLRFSANQAVQMLHTGAPNSNIRFYVAESATYSALQLALSQAISDRVSVISNGWNGCENLVASSTINSYHTLFQSAAARGIAVLFASGDNGVFECNSGINTTNVGFSTFPGSDDLVTSVGGTTLSRDDTTGAWVNEIGWSCQDRANTNTCLLPQGGSSGGGLATQTLRPAYQTAISIPVEISFTNQPSMTTRAQPDISMNADPNTTVPIFFVGGACNDNCTGLGPAASTPLVASAIALAVQRSGGPVGGVNPFLYANRTAPYIFDVITGFNGVNARTGWDFVTGLGSLKDVSGFVQVFGVPSAFISGNGQTFNQLSGNSNGVVEPGESFSLFISLTNSGAVTATNISTTLRVISGSATISNGTSAYPNLTPNSTFTNTTPYSFIVSSTQVCGDEIRFRQTISYTVGITTPSVLTTTYDFGVRVGTVQTSGPITTYTYLSPPLTITDNSLVGITASLPISGAGNVGDINASINISHTYVEDLIVTLVSPSGKRVILVQNQGGAGDNFSGTTFDDEAGTSIISGTAPFTGTYRPQEPLSNFDNDPISGTWRLNVVDDATGDEGTLITFSLTIQAAAGLCAPLPITPTLTAISPMSATVGSPAFTMTITGTNFVTNSVVQFNGSARATTFVSNTRLLAQIPPSDLTVTGTFTITVFTPGGGTSNGLPFMVTGGGGSMVVTPTLTAISPISATVGSPAFTMTITGTNFVTNSVVQFNGSPRATTFVSSTRLLAQIPTSDLTVTGTFTITVLNPGATGGTSNGLPFLVVSQGGGQVCTNPSVVTSLTDDFNCGSFRTALISATVGTTITFQVTGTITISSSLPVVPAGVSIRGDCSGGQPRVIIDGAGTNGDGLSLNGNTSLFGLKIMGFNGSQIRAGQGNNRLFCVIAQTRRN